MNKSIILIIGCLMSLILLTITPSGMAVIPINEAVEINIPSYENYTEVFHIDENPIDIEIELYFSKPAYFDIIIAKAKHENDKNITSDSQIILNETNLKGGGLYKFPLNTKNSTYIVRIENNFKQSLEGILAVRVEYQPARIDTFRLNLESCLLFAVIIVGIILIGVYIKKS